MKRLHNNGIPGIFFCCLLLLGCAGIDPTASNNPSLTSSTLEIISNAVMEVVVPKPQEDPLEYEKPLPLDLLPYSIRTDKYYSIGTAFAISPEEFVTVAHVMKLGSESRYKEIFLRDRQGHVYPVADILKYSLNRDFVVFTLHDAETKYYLPINAAPHINQKVYAVGNALGQGIVIRDGLYTSETPEEEAGRWNWIRFSAAASPGNSGGPLLDVDGKVIGIVRGKSPSENLNYAVPIAEVVKAPTDKADIHIGRLIYRLDNMDMTVRKSLDKKLTLPKSYDKLSAEFKSIITEYFQHLRGKILSENRETIFPRGPGSTRLLYDMTHSDFPLLIAKGRDDHWTAMTPPNRKKADLGNNGSLSYGKYGKTYLMLMRKPDSIQLKTLYSDSKQFMDLICKSGLFVRYIPPEKVKIISLGKAEEDYGMTDTYGRKWIVRTWLSEFDDTKIVTFTLPVPDGCIIVLRKIPTDMVEIIDMPELKILSDFVFISYEGLFKDWREFLTLKDLLPDFFSSIHIKMDPNDTFRFESERLSFFYGPDIMQMSENSFLMLGPVFLQNQGKTVLDIGKIMVREDRFDQTSYMIQRIKKPPADLPDQYHSLWEKMTSRKFPYNRSAYFKDKVTIIETVYPIPKSDMKDLSDAFIYIVGFTKPGTADQKEMESKLNSFLTNLSVSEKTP
ncbi:MAG: trypsin-like peptidase domain-containing protein [Deltaproteobacteria bacterium]|nr:trypsin-like peptidase domain-containing protein [Deltaproteobacteria bacterium]